MSVIIPPDHCCSYIIMRIVCTFLQKSLNCVHFEPMALGKINKKHTHTHKKPFRWHTPFNDGFFLFIVYNTVSAWDIVTSLKNFFIFTLFVRYQMFWHVHFSISRIMASSYLPHPYRALNSLKVRCFVRYYRQWLPFNCHMVSRMVSI